MPLHYFNYPFFYFYQAKMLHIKRLNVSWTISNEIIHEKNVFNYKNLITFFFVFLLNNYWGF